MCHKTNSNEIPVVFKCQGDQLIGMIHQTIEKSSVGVLIIVGGLQYRVGSHRQFVLLARHLAKKGVSTMRFDVRGMGNSEGESRNFEQIDNDIRSAIDCFFEKCPELNHVILWGLCDAASAALFYGYQDVRVKGLVLLNPWIFTEIGSAKTVLKHYYLKRLISKDFWRKLFSLKFNYWCSFVTLIKFLRKIFISKAAYPAELDLPNRMRECIGKFHHQILFILSGNDLTANEFKEAIKNDNEWQKLLNHHRTSRFDITDADHTFSSSKWRQNVEITTTNWITTVALNLKNKERKQ